MLQNLKSILIALLVLHVAHVAYGQVDTIYIPIKYDSYIDESTPSTNYGSDTLMTIGHFTDTSTHYQRVYVYFETDSIPPNAYVSGMQMQLPFFNELNTQDTLVTSRVLEQWYEDSITYNNQPTISSITDGSWTWNHNGSQLVLASSPVAMRKIMDGFYENHGFVIQMENETDTNQAYVNLGTSEHSDTTKRPKVMIIYYYPIEIQNIQVRHESHSGAADGSISFETLYGTQDFTYEWIDGSTGNVISTDSVLDSLSYGWYGVKISGNLNDVYYHAFLVGVECDTVSISVQLDKFYTDYAFIANTTAGDGTENEFVNFGNPWGMMAMNWNGGVNGWNQQRTLIDPLLYMDPAFNIQQADYTMYGSNHYYNNWKTNKCELELITEDWHELKVTFNNQPTFSDTIKVLVDSTHYATQNRTADVTDFWNYWKEDYSNKHGMMFKIESETNTFIVRQMYHPVSSTTASLRPLLEFTLDLVHQSYTDMAWDTESETGSITVDIGKYCGTKTAPYKYLISTDSIPDLEAQYDFIRDTIFGGTLDSTKFFNGTDTTRMVYSDLLSGRYYISVFDSSWNRLTHERVDLFGSLDFTTQTGLSLSSNVITSSQSNAYGELELYTHESRNAGIIVEQSDFTGSQFYGFAHSDTTVNSYEDLDFGVYLSNDTLYPLLRGVKGTGVVTDTNDVIAVKILSKKLKIFHNSTQVYSANALDTFSYKVGVGMSNSNMIAKIIPVYLKKKKGLGKVVVANITYSDCENNPGSFTFYVAHTALPAGAYSITYSVVNDYGDIIAQNVSANTLSSIIIDDYNSTPLTPGIYTVSGTISSPSPATFLRKIYLGNEMEWKSVTDYNQTPNSYSLYRDNSATGTWSKAKSNSLLPANQTGWVHMETVTEAGANYIRLTDLFTANVPPSNEDFIAIAKFLSVNILLWNIDGIPEYTFTDPDPSLAVAIDNNLIEISANDQIEGSPSATNQVRFCNAQTNGDENKFNNIVTTFHCKSNIIFYYLKNEVEQSIAYLSGATLRFKFDENYFDASGNLTYEFLNLTDDTYNTGTVSKNYGVNWIEISNGTNGLVLNTNDIYLLTVTNAKGQKAYLKFKKG